MSSISIGELKTILDQYPDDYKVEMHIKHRYPISKEEGEKGWIAYINGYHVDTTYCVLSLMN